MENIGGHKRSREDENGSPEAKRIHSDPLLDFLSEDDSDADGQDLATVMKSLEEEIAQPTAVISSDMETRKVEIEYLQEASDDELGIPPPEAELLEDERSEGFGRIWVFEDEGIPAWYEGLVEFGYLTAEDNKEVLIDGGNLDGVIMGCF